MLVLSLKKTVLKVLNVVNMTLYGGGHTVSSENVSTLWRGLTSKEGVHYTIQIHAHCGYFLVNVHLTNQLSKWFVALGSKKMNHLLVRITSPRFD